MQNAYFPCQYGPRSYTLLRSETAAFTDQTLKIDLKRKKLSAAGFRFAIVVSRWNDEITAKLSAGANEALIEAGAKPEHIQEFTVPGAFEVPVACLKAAQTGNYHGVIGLGVVIRGDTPHFDFVAGQAAAGIMRASMDTGVPVMFGVITVDTFEQALARSSEKADNKGYEAAQSAIEMAHTMLDLDERNERFFKEQILANVV